MPVTSLLLALALAPQGSSNAPVVINEFLYDNSSTDVIEFVELYNRSGQSIDISGWVLDSEDPSGPNTAHTIPAGTVLGAGGRWTIGADAANPGNIDQVVGTTNLWENSNESLTLRDPNGRIVDTLVYESVRGVWDPTLAEGGVGVLGQQYSNQSFPVSYQRCPDGNDNDDNGRDFFVMPMTPAAPNFSKSLGGYTSTFDAAMPGDPVAEFAPSFVQPFVIDPTAAANGNPNAIPASPTGGNAMIAWDPTGGGNAGYFANTCIQDVRIRACVYIDGALTAPASGEGETWNIGVRGAVGGFGHHTDPSGAFYPLVGGTWLPGNTGVAACWQRCETYNKLFLVDYGDGGTTTLVGSIDIVPGTNDGWQLFQLTVVGDKAELTWGKTTVSGTVRRDGPGGVYIGYRELRVDNTQTRPPTIDDLLIVPVASSTRFLGGPAPNSNVAPHIDLGSAARVGQTHDVLGMGVVPGTAFLGMGIERAVPVTLGPPLFPKSALYIWLLDSVAINAVDAAVRFSHQVPNSTGVLGIEISYQYIQLDQALPYPIPLSHTPGMVVRIGS